MLSEKAKRILGLLVSLLPTVDPGDLQTFPTYKLIHDELGLKLSGGTYGRSLQRQGLESLALWLRDQRLPAITGLVVDQKRRRPGPGFFEVNGRPVDDRQWWLEEAQRSKEHDWSSYIDREVSFAPSPDSETSLRAALLHIGQRLQQARSEPFQDHPLARFIRHQWPAAIRTSGVVPEGIWVEASAGKGKWADSPWLALLYSPVTDTTQGGFYPVYLFAPDGQSVALSLNQGITHVRAEEGLAAARESLAHRAREFSDRVGKDLGRFSTSPINLGSTNKGSRLELYEWGHAFGVAYSLPQLPDETDLKEDLRSMVKLYLRLAAQGEATDSDEDEEARVAAVGDSTGQMMERRRYRYHRTIERNSKLARKAKALLGTVCQVCRFDFFATYGEVGRGFIEAHHKVPISQLPEGEPVPHDPKTDFAVVCANCHRMLHRSNAPAGFDEFVDAFRRQFS